MASALPASNYEPSDPAAFSSLVTKMADRLGTSYNQVAYHLSLDPEYYDDDVAKGEFNFADAEFALGISDAHLMSDQKVQVQKAYGLYGKETAELLSAEQHWLDK